jgi:putative endonuclease
MARARRWCVYVLRCRDGSLYTGATNDLDRRVARHAAGRGARYTRSRLPVALVHVEPARGRSAALRREAAVKRLPRAAKLALVGTGAGAAPPARRAQSPRACGARASTRRSRTATRST